MAAPLAIGMVFQTLYFLVDLYFVAQLGDTALAGVGAAGIVQFVIMALTQVLGVGTMVLIAGIAATLTLAVGYLAGGAYLGTIAADAATTAAGTTYLYWFLPAMAIAFAAAPIASQNIAAGLPERARETFSSAIVMGSALMALLTLLCQQRRPSRRLDPPGTLGLVTPRLPPQAALVRFRMRDDGPCAVRALAPPARSFEAARSCVRPRRRLIVDPTLLPSLHPCDPH